MSVSDGQAVNAAVTNAAFMSRTADTSTTGVVDLNNITDANSGAQITNIQQAMNETFDAVGMTGIGDATRKNYSSNNVVADGDAHKVAIGKLDTNIVLRILAPSSTDNAVARYDGVSGALQNSGVIIDDTNNVTGVNNLTVDGDLIVSGNTVTLNTATLDVEDTNITVNKGGNDATSEGAGITIERTGTNGAFLYEDALASKFKAGALGSEVEILNISAAQVITNKDIDGGTAANNRRITIPQDTKTNLDALTRKEGTIVYANDLDALYVDDGSVLNEVGGSGSGAGRVNHLTGDNTDFETTTGSWAGFDEGAVSTPVDLTGGTPTVVTFARNTTNPLDTAGDLKISHSAADGQGEGLSVAVTARIADKGLMQEIAFNYQTDTNYADDDLEIWVYDVTNSQLIQPTPFKLKSTGGLPGRFSALFQANSDSTSYRVGFFCSNTTATAYDVQVDNVLVGPPQYNFGVPSSDWTAFTPTGTWTGGGTYEGAWRRVGDTMELWARFNATGGVTPAATQLQVNLPSGYSIDTSKLALANTASVIGNFTMYDDSTSTRYMGNVMYISTTAVQPHCYSDITTFENLAAITHNNIITIANLDKLEMFVKVPIQGWSSNVRMSDDADTRVVAAHCSTAAGQSIGNGSIDIINFDTVVDDTHGAITTGASWKFTAPISGRYKVSAVVRYGSLAWTANSGIDLNIYKNGAAGEALGLVTLHSTATYFPNTLSGSTEIVLNAGDYIDLRTQHDESTSRALQAAATVNHVSIERLSGPSAIAASEKVFASYEYSASTANSALAAATSEVLDFDTKIEDTHGAVTTGSDWRFIAPRSSVYDVTTGFRVNALTPSAISNEFTVRYTVNGGGAKNVGISPALQTGGAANYSVHGDFKIKLDAGDALRIEGFTTDATTLNTNSNCFIMITSQGGV